jgi:hypothetical protein
LHAAEQFHCPPPATRVHLQSKRYSVFMADKGDQTAWITLATERKESYICMVKRHSTSTHNRSGRLRRIYHLLVKYCIFMCVPRATMSYALNCMRNVWRVTILGRREVHMSAMLEYGRICMDNEITFGLCTARQSRSDTYRDACVDTV